jgi:HAD superfamily hydrolase (TIGR01509 family)
VLSESIAFEACAELANEVLEKHGVPDRYTGPALLHEFVGQNFRGMLVSLTKKYGFTLPEPELASYVDRELGQVTAALAARAEPCEGALDVVRRRQAQRAYELAVVSSSALSRVEASIRKVGLADVFPDGRIFSAASSLPKPTSKPDPAVYLFACEKLGAQPGACVAIEDSRSGATAAKNAGIPLIGYVGPYETAEERETMTKVLRDECGAIVVMNHWNEFADALKKVEAA